MILGEADATATRSGGQTTLDDLFRATAERRPGAIALADPPDRDRLDDRTPLRLTYAQADRFISAIARRLRQLGLPTDAVIGIQLPNTAEAVLTLLAVLRAGMIATPLPLLWRRADAVAALGAGGAKAIITCASAGAVDHATLAMEMAAELFPVRHVCGFGAPLPDGVLPLDDLLVASADETAPHEARSGNAAAHVAVVTFETGRHGTIAVARNHIELIAGGVAVLLEAGIASNAVILSPCPPSSLAGLAVGVLPWLLSGGTLALQQAFDAECFAAQCRDEICDTVAVPGPLIEPLRLAGVFAPEQLRNVLAVWHAPERLAQAPRWEHADTRVCDVLVFGESGLVAARRDREGFPAALALGPLTAPRGVAGSVDVGALRITAAGTLALCGAMVPRHAFPPGIAGDGRPCLTVDAEGFIDTGHGCRVTEGGAVTLTAPPPGIVTVGGYRLAWRDAEAQVRNAVTDANFVALPHALLGHRLAAQAADGAAAATALAARGAHALILSAFGAAPGLGKVQTSPQTLTGR